MCWTYKAKEMLNRHLLQIGTLYLGLIKSSTCYVLSTILLFLWELIQWFHFAPLSQLQTPWLGWAGRDIAELQYVFVLWSLIIYHSKAFFSFFDFNVLKIFMFSSMIDSWFLFHFNNQCVPFDKFETPIITGTQSAIFMNFSHLVVFEYMLTVIFIWLWALSRLCNTAAGINKPASISHFVTAGTSQRLY